MSNGGASSMGLDPKNIQILAAMLQDLGANFDHRQGNAIPQLAARNLQDTQRLGYQNAVRKLSGQATTDQANTVSQNTGYGTPSPIPPKIGGDELPHDNALSPNEAELLKFVEPSDGAPVMMGALKDQQRQQQTQKMLNMFSAGGQDSGPAEPQPSAPGQASPIFDGATAEDFISKTFPGSRITSGLRTTAQNTAAGGVPNSLHLANQARDFVPPPGMDIEAVASHINSLGYPGLKAIAEGPGAPHSTAPHVHLQWENQQQNAVNQQAQGTPTPITPQPSPIGGSQITRDQALQLWASNGADPTKMADYLKLTQQQKSTRMLLPNELKAHGYAPGSVVQVDETGAEHVVQSPPTMRNPIPLTPGQPVLDPNTGKITTPIQSAYDRLYGADAGATNDPHTEAERRKFEMLSWGYLKTGHMPPLGQKNNDVRDTILTRSAEIAQKIGIAPQSIAALQSGFGADAAAQKQVSRYSSMMSGFQSALDKNADIVLRLLDGKGVGTTGAPVFNRWQRYAAKQYAGDPDVVALDGAINTVNNQYAKISSGSIGASGASDTSRMTANEMLNPQMTPAQIRAQINQMKLESRNETSAFAGEGDALTAKMSAIPGAPQAAQSQQAHNDPFPGIPDGAVVTQGGRKFKRMGNQMVPVQ